MQVCLDSEIIEKLSYKGVMAYVAVSLAGNVDATTAYLASLVKGQSSLVMEGLKELSEEAPELVGRLKKGRWHCGAWAATGMVPVEAEKVTRYASFIDDLKKYWDFLNPSFPFQMGGKDGVAIRRFLSDHPNWAREHWLEALRNRAKSPVVRSAPFFTWVERLSEFGSGPLNEFNKPQEGTGKHGQAAGVEESNRAARDAALAKHRA